MKHGVIPVRRCFMRLRTVASHCHTPTPAITSRSASDCETAAGPNERRSCRLLTSLVATAAQLEGGIARGEGAAGSHTSRTVEIEVKLHWASRRATGAPRSEDAAMGRLLAGRTPRRVTPAMRAWAAVGLLVLVAAQDR
jgi:hypothetical protein